eukprot:gb/GECH01014816.1/.p1 GENE.gb/GECH01014816.1/~~gb/GECH01014816.1/.p1  ORF type:complete len:319 (+),score=49.02 gb/GECH01014816.1/:1-957(+)
MLKRFCWEPNKEIDVTARFYLTSLIINRKIWLFSGIGCNSSTLDIVDLDTFRVEHKQIKIDNPNFSNKTFSAIHFSAKEILLLSNDQVFLLNMETLKMRIQPTSNNPSALTGHHSASLMNNRIYVARGVGQPAASLYYIDLDNWTWYPFEDIHRSESAQNFAIGWGSVLVPLNDQERLLIAFGNLSRNHHIIDTRSNRLLQKVPIPDAMMRNSPAACRISPSHVLFYGGYSNAKGSATNDLLLFDEDHTQFRSLETDTPGTMVYGHTMQLWQQHVFIFGKLDSSSSSSFSVLEVPYLSGYRDDVAQLFDADIGTGSSV